MANIIRRQESPVALGWWEPFRLMREMMRRDFPDIGSLFESSPFRDVEQLARGRAFSPDLEVTESKDHYTICADLPGMRDENVEISVEGNQLCIRGEREEERHEEGEQRYVVERSYGSFSRSFTLPETANLDGIEASLKDGVLRIEIPKKVGMKSKQIPIGGKGSRALEAGKAGAATAEQEKQERAEERKGKEKEMKEKEQKAA